MLPFLLISAWSAYSGLKSIVYVSAILLPIVWILGIFVALSTIEAKDYSYLFPVLVDGYSPVVKGTVIVLGGSADLLVRLRNSIVNTKLPIHLRIYIR
jgi:spore germination protein KB